MPLGRGVTQRDRWIGRGEQVGGGVEDPVDPLLEPAAQPVVLGEPPLVGVGAVGDAFGDDGADPRVGRRPRRRPPRPPSTGRARRCGRRRPGLRADEVDGSPHVEVAVPAEVHPASSAAAVAAGVEQQHAVAVAGEHGRLVEDRRSGRPDPCSRITAARLFDGTYQAEIVTPSEVR